MYCTCMGNGRIVVFEYDEHEVNFSFAFGDAADGSNGKGFTPLSDPNGFHSKGDPRVRPPGQQPVELRPRRHVPDSTFNVVNIYACELE